MDSGQLIAIDYGPRAIIDSTKIGKCRKKFKKKLQLYKFNRLLLLIHLNIDIIKYFRSSSIDEL